MLARLRVAGARALARDEGATAVEYVLMVALVTLVILAAVGAFGQAVLGLFQNAVDKWPA